VAITFSGDALLWEAEADPFAKIKVWTAAQGAADLISFGGDTSQGAGDLGTDGRQMVWLNGSARAQPFGTYPNAVFMESPYATDPTQIQPRRVRSEPGGDAGSGLGASPTQVGCGYAAREFPGGIRVVRIVDGVSWVLPQAQAGVQWGWLNALAVTCTHLYASVLAQLGPGNAWTSTIARVRLDSLGPGIPSD
jgi:hypothetical protein